MAVANKKVAKKVEKPVEERPEIKLPEGWVNVASKGYVVDPFEGTKFSEGVPTQVKKTSWVGCQMEAGILVEV